MVLAEDQSGEGLTNLLRKPSQLDNALHEFRPVISSFLELKRAQLYARSSRVKQSHFLLRVKLTRLRFRKQLPALFRVSDSRGPTETTPTRPIRVSANGAVLAHFFASARRRE